MSTWSTLAATAQSSIQSWTDDTTTTYRVTTARVSVSLIYRPSSGVSLTELTPAGGIPLLGIAGTSPFALAWTGPSPRPPLATARLIDAIATVDDSSVTLALTLDLAPLTVTYHLRAHDGLAVVQSWITVATAESGTLTGVVPFDLALATNAPPTLTTIAGVQQQGGWRPETGEYRSFRREEHHLGTRYVGESGIRSTWDEIPWYAIVDPTGSGASLFAGLEYSGRWRLDAAYDVANGSVRCVLAPVGNEPTLTPGIPWTSPITFIGCVDGDLDAVAAAGYDFYRTVLCPPLPTDFPWVQYNTWYAYFCDLDHDTLAREVDIAADLGVEVFYLDAGWWVGSPKNDRRDYFTSGLGHWVENRDKFPQGIAGFADLVRAHGLHAGIWVEPERVDIRTAGHATWKPEWIATSAGRYIGPPWPPDTDSAWLCFGHPEVQAWAIDWVGELVASMGARWLKWDSNFWGVCDCPDHGHGLGDAEAAQLSGVHIVLDALRARFPDLVIENCAGGGTRMDFGFASKTHVAWVSDATDPPQRVRAHMDGALYLFPPAVLNTWMIGTRYEDLNRHDYPEPVLRANIRSRMLGAFGISARMTGWTAQTRRIVAEEIAAFKADRHLIARGYVARLLPQSVLDSASLKPPSTWEAWQFHSGDGADALVFAFRNLALKADQSLILKHLDPAATYRATDEAQDRDELVSGASLMIDGLPLMLLPLTSGRIRLRRIASGPRP